MKRLGFPVVSVDRIMDEKDMWREGHPIQEDWNAAYSEAYRQIKEYLKARKTVIFDCANLPFHERENARKIADGLEITHQLIYVNTPTEEILRRRQENEPTESENPIIYNHQVHLDHWIELYFH